MSARAIGNQSIVERRAWSKIFLAVSPSVIFEP
jgi:hypothetical protein